MNRLLTVVAAFWTWAEGVRHRRALCVYALALIFDVACLAQEPVDLPSLTDIDGRTHDLTAAESAAPVVVLAWTGSECPMARLYLPRIKRVAETFGPRGVRCFLVNSNSHDSPGSIRRATGELPAHFVVIRDAQGELAEQVGARSTTEVFVLDARRRVVYRGALDDQYGFRRSEGLGARTYRKEAPTLHYLRDAIEAALAGRVPSPRETDPLGCALEWLPADPTAAARKDGTEKSLTFHEHVEPILQAHCQGCHHDGGIAPFALVEYRAALGWRQMIREVVSERRMPPWGASPDHGTFANDSSLTETQIDTIVRWVDSGAPRGDPAGAPPRRGFTSGWTIRPDVQFTTPPFEVPAEGSLPYRYARVPTSFEDDRWIEAMQIRSTTPGIVHHVLVLLAGVSPPKPGTTRPWRPPFNPFSLLEGAKEGEHREWIHRFRDLITRDLMIGGGGGLSGYLASSSSGSVPMIFPEGRAKLLPAGATLVFQIHYTPNGKPQVSETTLALRLAAEPPDEAVDTRAIATVAFRIPPGDGGHVVEATNRFIRDGLVTSLRPHLHVRGKSFRYIAEFPDGRHEVLLDVPLWDFDWQLDYVLAEPLRLPRGTVLRAIAAYDNSPDNPYNPDPTQEVYFGIQTDDEMMIGYYDVVWLEPGPETP